MSYSLIKYAYSLSADYALKLFALTCLLVVHRHLKSDNRLKLCLKWAKFVGCWGFAPGPDFQFIFHTLTITHRPR